MKNLKKIYLNNYRGIHHIAMFFILFFVLYMFGLAEIFTSSATNFIVQIVFIGISYLLTEFTLQKSGLNDEIVKEKEKDKT